MLTKLLRGSSAYTRVRVSLTNSPPRWVDARLIPVYENNGAREEYLMIMTSPSLLTIHAACRGGRSRPTRLDRVRDRRPMDHAG